jgi:uncharacterized membrane protein YcaP (DUF421 family)
MYELLFDIDWRAIFVPDTPLLEIFIRGTLTYLGIFILLRVVGKRETSEMSRTDLLVLLLVADAAQNAMADDYRSVPDGLLLVATIMFWSHVINWLEFHYPWFERLGQPSPVMLVRDGVVIARNMRRELVTRMELMDAVRQAGYESLAQVKHVIMEGNGKLSVIPREK